MHIKIVGTTMRYIFNFLANNCTILILICCKYYTYRVSLVPGPIIADQKNPQNCNFSSADELICCLLFQSIMKRKKVSLRSKHDFSRLYVHSLRNTLNTSTLPYQRISEYATKATSSPRMANSSMGFLWEGATCFVVNREYEHFYSFHSFSHFQGTHI